MFKQLHHFYHRICPECADFNYQKRSNKADLKGKYALVTGGRTKIGYIICLSMLRNGATVYITTRFPKNCIESFSKEKDFN